MKYLKIILLILIAHTTVVKAQEQPENAALTIDSVGVKPAFKDGEKRLNIYVKKNLYVPVAQNSLTPNQNTAIAFVIENGIINNVTGLDYFDTSNRNQIIGLIQNNQQWFTGGNTQNALRMHYSLPFSLVFEANRKHPVGRQPFGGKPKKKSKKFRLF